MRRGSFNRSERPTRRPGLTPGGGPVSGLALAVVGASGRAGASTLAAACAVVAADVGVATVALDLQPGGPGLDALLGVEHRPGLRWADLTGVEGGVDGPALLQRLPRCGELAVLSHGRDGDPVPSVEQVAAVVCGLRAGAELLVLDLWRGHALTGAHAVGLRDGDVGVLLAEATPLALAALRATAAGLAAALPDTYVLLRGGATARAFLGDVQEALDLPVLGCLGEDLAAARDLARGRPPGRLAGPVRDRAADLLSIVLPGRARVAS